MAQWKDALATSPPENPEALVLLYTDDAVLWGTLSKKPSKGSKAIRAYFTKALADLPNLRVSFKAPEIRIHGNVAINTGTYTLIYKKDGEKKALPARYSFTLIRQGKKWLITDHHSSVMPG